MDIQSLDEKFFSPILQAPSHTSQALYYKSPEHVWKFFLHPATQKLTNLAIKSVTSKFKLHQISEDMKVEILVQKVFDIREQNGLRYPKSGDKKGFRWAGWFVKIIKHATYDLLEKFIPPQDVYLDTLENKTHEIFYQETPESRSLHAEKSQMSMQIRKRSLQFLLHATSPDLTASKRLCFLMLNHPEIVTGEMFFDARIHYDRPWKEAWRLWQEHFDAFVLQHKTEGINHSKSRSFITWLLNGKTYESPKHFERFNAKKFNTRRDTIRKTINRAYQDIQYAYLISTILNVNLGRHSSFHSMFLEKALEKNKCHTNRRNLIAWQNLNKDRKSPQSIKELAALLHSNHSTFKAWYNQHAQSAQNRYTRLYNYIQRLETIERKSKTA